MLAEACVGVLNGVFERGEVLDRMLARLFEANPRWGKRDRGFVAETVFEVVRWRRALAFVADAEGAEALCAVQWRRKELEIPEWWQWQGASLAEMAQREGVLSDQPRAVRESVPDWLDERCVAELGMQWDAELAALNCRAPIFLRVNTLRSTRDGAQAWLSSQGVETELVTNTTDALRVLGERQIPKPLLAEGIVEIQDAGSQQIAPLLEVEPGMRVIDACAGAGGKTLQLAAMMQNRGELAAFDVIGGKLTELLRRAQRAGVTIVKTERWGPETLRKWNGWADRVLIDAPCSGLGTLRRQPDLKWRLSEESLEKTRRLQRRLLDHYPELLRKGGKFVYATCSVLPSENGGQLTMLHERNGRWIVEEECNVSLAASGWDGFYAGRLAGS